MAYTIYIQFKNGTQTTVADVTAESKEDVDYFDGSTYRDGPYYAAGTLNTGDSVVTTNTDSGASLVEEEVSFTLSTTPFVVLGSTTGTAPTTSTPASITHVVADDALKIPPRPHPRKRTRYKWTTAGGTYWAWGDLIVAVSSSAHTYI